MVVSKWRGSVLLHSLKIKFININMIKIFLQNLSASEFKKSNFTNHRQARIQKIFPGGVQPSRITVEVRKYEK